MTLYCNGKELTLSEVALIERIGATHIYFHTLKENKVIPVYCKYIQCNDLPYDWYFYDGWGYSERLPEEVNLNELYIIEKDESL